MPILLQVTGFIAVLWVLARSYQDSEMVVWFSSGMSLTRWVRPVLVFGMPIVLLTGLLSFFVTPWASKQSAEFRQRYEKRSDIDNVQPGKFYESAGVDRVYSFEGNQDDASNFKNVFISTNQNGKNSVIVSKQGTIETDAKGDKYLVLSNGRRYDGEPNQYDYEIMQFEHYHIFLAHQTPSLTDDQSADALPTDVLLAHLNPFNLAELMGRIAQPIMSFTLLLLAIPLSFVNPRGGRSANVIIALLLWFTYLNLVKVVQDMIKQGRIPFMLSWWVIHAAVMVIVLFSFYWRLNMNSAYHPLALWSSVKRLCLKRRVKP
jgi:lipopolysaccharide export system permease protein